jgi:hypothetical protein
MYKEDNSGFVNFPSGGKEVTKIESGKTLVYLVAFEVDLEKESMSNINLFLPGIFVSDDVVTRPDPIGKNYTLDDVIRINKEQDFYDSLYFPNIFAVDSLMRDMSIDLISSVFLGWSNFTYEYSYEIRFWNATFKDLTNEGKKLYHLFRKLHNNKEIRILTFNNI